MAFAFSLVSACSNAGEEKKEDVKAVQEKPGVNEGVPKDVSQDKPAAKPVTPHEMTKEMLLSAVVGTLDSDGEIMNFIPELKKQPTPDGKWFYTYHGIELSELEKDTLEKVSARVHNEAARIRAERLNRQLESIQRAHQNIVAAQQTFRPPVVTTPPQPPKQPMIPQQPPSAPQVPKAPQLPPAPPKK